MSKRSHDGTVMVARHTPDTRKRAADFVCEAHQHKRLRHSRPSPNSRTSQKRSAEFDCEVEHIHKRLKATTPTAEQAMAFLLPHILHLRRLYVNQLNENETLKEHNSLLTTAYNKLAQESTQTSNRLRRELDMPKYQLTLAVGR